MDLTNKTVFRYSISLRIITAFSILIIFFTVFILFVFNGLVKEAHIKVALDEMRDKTHFVENYLIAKYNTLDPDKKLLLEEIKQMAGITGLRVSFIAKDGKVIADSDVNTPQSMDNHKYRVEVMQAEKEGSGHSMRYSHTLETDMFYYAQNYDNYILRMAKPLPEMRASLIRIRQIMIYLGAIILLLSIIIVLFIVASITRPINETINFASQFASGDYTKRISNYSNSEIGMIQRSLNNMADQLVEKINSLVFEQNKLNITIESIADGITVINKEKKIVIVNKAFYKCIDVTRIKVSGLLFFEVIRNRTLNLRIEQSLAQAKPSHFEEELINGRTYDVSINPISEERTLQGVLVVLRDVTEKKKIEKIKTDLVSNMSHELKTPVTIIKGYLETIALNLNNTEQCSGYIRKAIENADRQTSIINDIIKLNMIETSNDFANEKIIIDDLIEGCVNILGQKAQLRDIQLNKKLEAMGEGVVGNKFLAEEIFFNLIDNAINYNLPGGEVNIESSISNNNQLTVKINDTGIGIPKESIDRIFERFYRVDKGRSRESGGTGLGLSIVKHAATLLGWKITVRSDSKGSSFRVIIYL
ncbi:MAG: HAMP domain-containing protein [Spirochaetes bacterium]|nr:HAMP domain-containing protein [Spirochaetota bacterium]MBN2770759.1 HAMP domain-containing protein [Spirochaetota bacterium]